MYIFAQFLCFSSCQEPLVGSGNTWVSGNMWTWWAGPSVLRNFNPGRDEIFRDGINQIFSSRDWWDPGIFWDGISLTYSSQDNLEIFYLKTNKSRWNHCFLWYNKSQKILGVDLPKSRDRDLSSIPGSQNISGSCWGLMVSGQKKVHLSQKRTWKYYTLALTISICHKISKWNDDCCICHRNERESVTLWLWFNQSALWGLVDWLVPITYMRFPEWQLAPSISSLHCIPK